MKTVLVGIPCLLVGGTEIQTLRLVEALVSGGYRVVTVCYFEYNAQMVNNYKIAGSEVICLSAYGRRPEVKKQRKFLYQGLRRVVKEYHPGIAHIQYMAPGALPILILRRLGVKTIVATTHTNADIYKNLRLVHFIEKHITKVFTCVSQSAEMSFFGSSQCYDDKMALQKHNHLTIYNGIKLDSYRDYQPKTISDTPVIGFVARMEKIKGADLVLPAFSKLLAAHPECRLKIVGDGSLCEMMQEQQKSLQIPNEKVEWLGRVNASSLPSLYRHMDIVWCPSRSEGFGLTVVEAMASGAVVVAANIGSLNEIIQTEDGAAGILVTPESHDALSDATCHLLDDEHKYRELSRKGIERVEAFSNEKYTNNVLSLYNKL